MKKGLRRWLGLGASAVVLGLIFYNLTQSAEWRDFRWDAVWLSLVHARPDFLLAAFAATYSSYLVRAVRWRFFLEPIKKGSLWVLFVGQILGFSSIYLIGRLGEFVRPAYIAKKEDVPISAMLAVLLLERIYDTVFMLLILVSAIEVVPLHPATRRGRLILAEAHRWGIVLLFGVALVVAGLVFFRLRADALAARFGDSFGFLPSWAHQPLKRVYLSFSQGLNVIRNWNDLLASLVSTVVLWAINTSLVWLVFQSLGGELGRLSWVSSGLVLFFAALGLLGQVPVLGGGYQGAAFLALNRIFGVHGEAATSAAILLWIMISVPCLALGVFLLIHEGLSFRRLKAIAEEESAAAMGKA